jgi:hypothetical protein
MFTAPIVFSALAWRLFDKLPSAFLSLFGGFAKLAK